MVTRENYEEYMIMYIDGELKPAEVMALLAFLDANPALKAELAVYEGTKMQPDVAVTLEAKGELLKPVAKRIAMPVWVRYSAAACVAALLIMGAVEIYWSSSPKLAKVIPADNLPVTRTAKSAADPARQISPPGPVADTAANKTVAYKTVVVKHNAGLHKEEAIKSEVAVVRETPKSVEKIGRMAIAATAKLAQTPENIPTQQQVNVPVLTSLNIAVPEPQEEARASFIDKLPIDELKKKAMKNIGQSIADEVNGNDGEKTLSVKIEKRKLVLSF